MGELLDSGRRALAGFFVYLAGVGIGAAFSSWIPTDLMLLCGIVATVLFSLGLYLTFGVSVVEVSKRSPASLHRCGVGIAIIAICGFATTGAIPAVAAVSVAALEILVLGMFVFGAVGLALLFWDRR